LEANVGPNQLKLALEALKTIEGLSRSVSFPFVGELNYAAKSLLGLFLMYLISPGLRMDFRAFMTLGDVSREGTFDAEHRRLPDPDRVKRKVLRTTYVRLKEASLINAGKIVYGDFRVATYGSPRILDHVPDEGIVCWAGVVNVRNRPRGERTSVFTFKNPEVKPLNWTEMKKLLAEPSHSRIEASREATKLSCDLLADLFNKNKITETKIMTELERLKAAPSVKLSGIAYFLCAVERSKGIAQRVRAVLQLFEGMWKA
jgi:hypothetical protein